MTGLMGRGDGFNTGHPEGGGVGRGGGFPMFGGPLGMGGFAPMVGGPGHMMGGAGQFMGRPMPGEGSYMDPMMGQAMGGPPGSHGMMGGGFGGPGSSMEGSMMSQGGGVGVVGFGGRQGPMGPMGMGIGRSQGMMGADGRGMLGGEPPQKRQKVISRLGGRVGDEGLGGAGYEDGGNAWQDEGNGAFKGGHYAGYEYEESEEAESDGDLLPLSRVGRVVARQARVHAV